MSDGVLEWEVSEVWGSQEDQANLRSGDEVGREGSSLVWLFSLISPVNKRTICPFPLLSCLLPFLTYHPSASYVLVTAETLAVAADAELLIHPSFLPRNAPYPEGSIWVLGLGHVFRVSRQSNIWGLLSNVHVPLLEAMCFFLSLCYPPKRDTAKRIWVVIWGGGSPKKRCEGVGV